MKTGHYIVIGIILTLMSCQTSMDEKNHPERAIDSLIIGDIDTAKILSQLKVKEGASALYLSNEKMENLSDRIDTLQLTYYFGYCDCQQWIVSEIYRDALKERWGMDEHDPRGQTEFYVDKHGYYIEAASAELEIDWRAKVNGTTVRFVGREYKDKRLPKDGEFTVPNPPHGKVLRYYSYQIIRPFQIWGPDKFTEVDKETGDSIKEKTILTVK